MKRLLFLFSLSLLFLAGCQKEKNYAEPENIVEQEVPRCGMEAAMANLSPETRSAMARNAAAAVNQAGELLVLLDFDGAVVRPGNGNAQGGDVRSPLVSNTRNCSAPNLTAGQKNRVHLKLSLPI